MNTQNGVEESFKNDFHFTTISTNSLFCLKWLKVIMGSESIARAQKVNIGCTIFFYCIKISKTHPTTFHLLGCGISTYKRSLSSQNLKYWEATVDSSPLYAARDIYVVRCRAVLSSRQSLSPWASLNKELYT